MYYETMDNTPSGQNLGKISVIFKTKVALQTKNVFVP